MNKSFIAFLFLFVFAFTSLVQGQDAPNQPFICGVKATSLDTWLKEFQTNPNSFVSLRSNNDILQLPLTIHLIGQSDGTGHFSMADLKVLLCELNNSFEPYNIRFFVQGNIRMYNQNAWYDQNSNTGNIIHQLHGVSNTINIYIANTLNLGTEGTIGGYAPIGQNRVYLAKNSIRGSGNKVLTHEMGHCLNLYHTFLGWEVAGIDYEEGTQAPSIISNETFSYLVERVDRSNCTQAADGFCDTNSDYLAFSWNCNNNNESPILQIDPTGQEFRSDGTNYMSYSNSSCQDNFSPQQVSAMRAHILSQKNSFLFSGTLPDPSEQTTVVVSPIDDQEVHFQNVKFTWQSHPNADQYLLEVSRSPSYLSTGTVVDMLVSDTSFVFNGDLLINRNYYWRVTPISKTDFCALRSESTRFRSVIQTSTTDLEGNSFNVFPTLLNQSSPIIIEGHLVRSMACKIEIININGRTVYQSTFHGLSGEFRETIPTTSLLTGIYILRIYTPSGASNIKIVKN